MGEVLTKGGTAPGRHLVSCRGRSVITKLGNINHVTDLRDLLLAGEAHRSDGEQLLDSFRVQLLDRTHHQQHVLDLIGFVFGLHHDRFGSALELGVAGGHGVVISN